MSSHADGLCHWSWAGLGLFPGLGTCGASWSVLSPDLCLADSFLLCESRLRRELLRETYFDQQPHSYSVLMTLVNRFNIDQGLQLPCFFLFFCFDQISSLGL